MQPEAANANQERVKRAVEMTHSSGDYAVQKWKAQAAFPLPAPRFPLLKIGRTARRASRLPKQSTSCCKPDRSCVNKTGQLDLLTTEEFAKYARQLVDSRHIETSFG
jgi:hypothetical protein